LYERLLERLGPVLVNTTLPANIPTPDKRAEETTTPIGGEIHALSDRLQSSILCFEELFERISI
jgi:hypothetical protein